MQKSLLAKSVVISFVVVPLMGVVLAIWYLWQSWVTGLDLALMVSMYALTVFGITVGFHRMLTHRSFEAGPVVRFILLALGSMAMQGPAVEWAATHIKHHAETDTEDDPHSPLEGFFHAHLGWMINGNQFDLRKYGRWMWNDRLIMFMSRTFFLWAAVGFLVPYLIGGWTGVLWGALVRVFLTQHVTWSVNSVCHMFGRKMFVTDDQSRNHWLVGLLAFGEGWHNNHHAFPRSAFHGMRWWQFDMSAYLIMLMEKLGLVWNVHRIPMERQEPRLNRPEIQVPVPQPVSQPDIASN